MTGYRLALFVLILLGVALMFAGLALDALRAENAALRFALVYKPEVTPEPETIEGVSRVVG